MLEDRIVQSSYVLFNSDILSQSVSVGIILRMNPFRPDIFDALKRFEFHETAYINKNSIYSLEGRMLRNLFFMRNFFKFENTSEVLKGTFL
jgi:hypothetical protein